MRYLSAKGVLIIHALIVDATGGTHGVRDEEALLSIIERPKMSAGGKDAYPDVFAKAAAYMHSIAMFHVFIDGNKRTALGVAVRFLETSDYTFTASNEEAEAVVLRVVTEKLDVSDIAEWLREHTKRIEKE